jgi:hypothetical protein
MLGSTSHKKVFSIKSPEGSTSYDISSFQVGEYEDDSFLGSSTV